MGDGAPASTAPPGDDGAGAHEPEPVILTGTGTASGVVVGRAVVFGAPRSTVAHRRIAEGDVATEIDRMRVAVDEARQSLREVSERLPAGAPETAPILDAYQLMLGDPLLHECISRKIRDERKCAEWATVEATDEIARRFVSPGTRDAYIEERRHDVEFVGDRLVRALVGDSPSEMLKIRAPSIVVAHDLSPADTASMVRHPALGFLTEVGSRTSHTAIMARALDIPAVLGVRDALSHVRSGDLVIVDALSGQVTVHPTAAMVAEAQKRARDHGAFTQRLLAARATPCTTRCGAPVALKANIELPAESVLALDSGAVGIGLYRTEFLYIDRATQPDEEEQFEVYRAVAEAMQGHPVTLRTFDVGGDKFVSSFQLPAEMNPALGLRAVRLALENPALFLVQLRAMVRASAFGPIRIMIPMVSSLAEVRAARALLDRAIAEVHARGQATAASIPFGTMIEVPSAALMADRLAREVDFFSIGTNDLVQYSMAVDRTSHALAHLASPFDPAILRLIRMTVDAARPRGIEVSVCGAMASDPLAACLLLGLGLRELSMGATAIPEIKEALGRVTLAEAEAVAAAALERDTADEVESELRRAFAPRLRDLLEGVATP